MDSSSPTGDEVAFSEPRNLAVSTGSKGRPGLRGLAGYAALLIGAFAVFLVVHRIGGGLTAPPPPADAVEVGRAVAGRVDVVLHVTATLAAVIGLGMVLGRVMQWCGQPAVIGEVLAGIVLGPSVLGAWAPGGMALLIPPPTADPHGLVPAALKGVAQLGVILYMFLVGLELNAGRLRRHAHATIAVSHASIVAPFALGLILAIGLYPRFSHAGVPFTSFALFQGAAMAITAFPVLARILADRGLDRTDLGSVALGCAATDDVSAWCLLALVVGVAQSDLTTAFVVIAGAVMFIGLMFAVVQPLLGRFVDVWDRGTEPLPPSAISGIFLAILLAALTTEAIGIHAVFGAFLLGAVIPHDGRIARELTLRLKTPVTVLLLPAFFAYTGMRTEIGLLSGWEPWLWCAAIILVATLGKFGGTFVAARLTGMSPRQAAALGALMNTRGLMELIVLNLGLDLGVISPTLFAMMLVMALVTTATTAPVLAWVLPANPATNR